MNNGSIFEMRRRKTQGALGSMPRPTASRRRKGGRSLVLYPPRLKRQTPGVTDLGQLFRHVAGTRAAARPTAAIRSSPLLSTATLNCIPQLPLHLHLHQSCNSLLHLIQLALTHQFTNWRFNRFSFFNIAIAWKEESLWWIVRSRISRVFLSAFSCQLAVA